MAKASAEHDWVYIVVSQVNVPGDDHDGDVVGIRLIGRGFYGEAMRTAAHDAKRLATQRHKHLATKAGHKPRPLSHEVYRMATTSMHGMPRLWDIA